MGRLAKFQSPGGDSPHCHCVLRCVLRARSWLFQSPGGDSPHCHKRCLEAAKDMLKWDPREFQSPGGDSPHCHETVAAATKTIEKI